MVCVWESVLPIRFFLFIALQNLTTGHFHEGYQALDQSFG